jgi:hypothetical protein
VFFLAKMALVYFVRHLLDVLDALVLDTYRLVFYPIVLAQSGQNQVLLRKC